MSQLQAASLGGGRIQGFNTQGGIPIGQNSAQLGGVQGFRGVGGQQFSQQLGGLQGSQGRGYGGISGLQGGQRSLGISGLQGGLGNLGISGLQGGQGSLGISGLQGGQRSLGISGLQGGLGGLQRTQVGRSGIGFQNSFGGIQGLQGGRNGLNGLSGLRGRRFGRRQLAQPSRQPVGSGYASSQQLGSQSLGANLGGSSPLAATSLGYSGGTPKNSITNVATEVLRFASRADEGQRHLPQAVFDALKLQSAIRGGKLVQRRSKAKAKA